MTLQTETVRKYLESLGENVPGKCDDCDGILIKYVANMTTSRNGTFYHYTTPRCNKCGKEYEHARQCITVGKAEANDRLHKLLNTPYGLPRD